MLHKCATKNCPNRFKYFGVGLLYALPQRRARNAGAPPPSTDSSSTARDQELELFWLCETCAALENENTLKRLPVIIGPALRKPL